MDWQTTLTKTFNEALEKALEGEDNLPDLAAIHAALEDAKADASAFLVEALKEACRGYGIQPKTSHDNPPIPIRNWDWSAFDDNTMDVDYGGPWGNGRTEVEALQELLEQCREMEAA